MKRADPVLGYIGYYKVLSIGNLFLIDIAIQVLPSIDL